MVKCKRSFTSKLFSYDLTARSLGKALTELDDSRVLVGSGLRLNVVLDYDSLYSGLYRRTGTAFFCYSTAAALVIHLAGA